MTPLEFSIVFQEFEIKHVPRKQNAMADKLSNEAIDCPSLQGLERRVCVEYACDDVVAMIDNANKSDAGDG